MGRLWCRFKKGAVKKAAPKPHFANDTNKSQKKVWTRTEINRLKVDELQEMAKREGFDHTLSGTKLKRMFIEHYGL